MHMEIIQKSEFLAPAQLAVDDRVLVLKNSYIKFVLPRQKSSSTPDALNIDSPKMGSRLINLTHSHNTNEKFN